MSTPPTKSASPPPPSAPSDVATDIDSLLFARVPHSASLKLSSSLPSQTPVTPEHSQSSVPWHVTLLTWAFFFTYLVMLGAVYVLIRAMSSDFPPVSMACTRFLIGGCSIVVFVCFYAWASVPFRERCKDVLCWAGVWRLLIMAAVNSLVPSVLQMQAIHAGVNAGAASVIMATAPIFAMILSHIFVGGSERMTRYKSLGSLTALVGVILVLLRNIVEVDSGGPVDYFLLVIASLCYGIAPVYGRTYCRHIHPLLISACQVFYAGVAAAVLMMALDYTIPPSPFPQHLQFFSSVPIEGWVEISVLGLISVVGFSIYFFLLTRIGPAMLSTANYFAPIVSIIGSIIFFDLWAHVATAFRALQVIGALIVAGSVFIINWETLRLEQKRAARARKREDEERQCAPLQEFLLSPDALGAAELDSIGAKGTGRPGQSAPPGRYHYKNRLIPIEQVYFG